MGWATLWLKMNAGSQDSPAYQFISIQELYDLLLIYVTHDSMGYHSINKTLARLARVSKWTSGPALDQLWKELSHPSQIISLLPDEVYKVHSPSGQYILRRTLVESDFVVFDKYAPRVQFVDINTSLTANAGCELFSTLKSFRDPIFPHLLRFDWHASAKFNTMGAFHLISRHHNVPRDRFALNMLGNIKDSDAPYPALKSFTTGAGLAETIALFQKRLSFWLPDVSTLEINTQTYLPRSIILEGIKSLSHLEHFDSRVSLGADILAYFAGLPYLKSLHIWKEEDATIASVAKLRKGTNSSTKFPVLEGLEFQTTRSAAEEFITLIESSCLERVAFEITDFHPIESSMFARITRLPNRTSTLRHFTFHTPDHALAATMRHVVFDISAFEPLFACHNLETLDLKVDAYAVEFDDTNLERMAASWPQLRTLRVYSRYTQQFGYVPPKVHLYTLWHLVEKCRELRQIEMAVDARVEGPFDPPHDSPVTCSHSVEKISFFLSPLANPTHVAAFLDRAFPNIIEFNAGLPKEEEARKAPSWFVVNEALPNVDREWRELSRRAQHDSSDSNCGFQ
ncbi:hypothetical protein GGX14DRAFT_468460 [Mycena pura]|uniref:F-box domain-containing protein n=1 Tax=Mycena pura TaxID=153505 RepID=A0AAD6Y8F9_9AGAR|nr:hypothetical protein GGX14DRAFT_468460 [Mycena pura]